MAHFKPPQNFLNSVLVSTVIACGLYAALYSNGTTTSPLVPLAFLVAFLAWDWRKAVRAEQRVRPTSAEETAHDIYRKVANIFAMAGALFVLGSRFVSVGTATSQSGFALILLAMGWTGFTYYWANATEFTASARAAAGAGEAVTKAFRESLPIFCLAAFVVGMAVGFVILVLLGSSAAFTILEPIIADRTSRYFTNLAIGVAVTAALAYPVLLGFARRATRRFSAITELQRAKSLQGYPPVWERP